MSHPPLAFCTKAKIAKVGGGGGGGGAYLGDITVYICSLIPRLYRAHISLPVYIAWEY